MKKLITSLVIIAIVVILIPAVCIRCTRVDSSEVGIKFNKLSLTEQGKLDASPVTGYVFYNPITTSVFTYPTFVQRVNYKPFTVNTKDAAIFTMDPTMAYYLNRDKATDVFFKYRKSLDIIEAGYMRTVIYDAYRVTANNYTSDELMANRAKFENEVRIMLDSALTNEGFTVTEFTSQIIPPESLRKTIDSKNMAVQESLRARNEVEKAKAEAEIVIAKAEGEAKAMRIKAESEAYANRIVASSLTSLLVKQEAISKWDGKVSTVSSSNSFPLINIE